MIAVKLKSKLHDTSSFNDFYQIYTVLPVLHAHCGTNSFNDLYHISL